MRAFDWLKGLFSSERGNVLVIGAATMPLLIGSAAFAVDTIQLSVWKRQLQRAADSSAIAGAYALSQSEGAADPDEFTHDAIHNDLDKNSFPTLSQNEGITIGPRLGFDRTVRVQLTATRTLPFMSIFTNAPATILADATAALADDGTFCMISLYDGEDAGIIVHGNAEVNLSCGMKTNSKARASNCTGAVITDGANANIIASPIASVGGLDGDCNNFLDDPDNGEAPTLLPNSAKQQDPLGYLPDPVLPAGQDCSKTLTPDTKPATGGIYCFAGIDVKSSETLNLPADSTIIVNGGDIDFQGDVNGEGVTFVMTGPDGEAGDLKVNSQANLALSSPDSGPYKGVLFYRDRRADNIEIKINGGADSVISGALYFPSSDITFAGNAGMDVKCLQMVGRKLKFGGGATVTNNCSTNPGAGAFQQTVVRLID